MKPYPPVLAIYLDTGCNLHCRFCLYDGRDDKPAQFSMALLDQLTEAIRHAKTICISAWGEPLLSPHFPEVLERIYSLNRGKNLIGIVTNGALLSAGVAKRLTGHLGDLAISLNASTRETYERDMKGGNWDRTRAAISEFVCTLPKSDRRKVSLHMVADAWNYEDILGLVHRAAEWNIHRVRVDQRMVATQDGLKQSLATVKEEYNLAVWQARDLAERNGVAFTARTFGRPGLDTCESPWTEAHVWADGRVAPCCYAGSLFVGNVYEVGIKEIWQDGYVGIRHGHAVCCSRCPKMLPFDDPRAHIYPTLQETLK